ncbi:MAG TPA: TIGR03118 family protein, partial [Pirellulales bacterium]|nr:TIGR03118 family protein [Pirellulales bacterium]
MIWRRRARRGNRKLRQSGPKAQGRFSLERLEDRQLLTASGYQQVNLVSDQAGAALVQDPNLVNPYGIALANGSGDIWVANAGSNTLTRYNGGVAGSAFAQDPLTVSAPSGVQGPTGIVWDSTNAFIFNQQNPAPFLFASQNGQISLVPSLTASQAAAGTSAAANSFYTGLALVVNGAATNLYAANFEAGTIDGFNQNLAAIAASGAFVDPNLPSGYSPYNIQVLSVGGTPLVFVTYAQQDPNNHQNIVPGAGHGLIDVYGVDGSFKAELITPSEGHIDAPWGLAMAPSGSTFGDLAGDLLVANADGTISAYSVNNTGGTLSQSFVSTLNDSSGAAIHIDGLHGLAFGNGASAGDATTLFFSAAPNSGTHGLLGELVNAFDNPIAAQGANITATGGVAFSGAVAAFTPQAALAGDTFTATIHWGDGTSDTVTPAPNGSGGFLVNGSHTYTQLGSVTPLTVDIVDTSTASATASTTGSAVVIDAHINATAVAVSTTEGVALTSVPVATFTDSGGQASTAFTATIDWGDGTTVDGGSVTGSNGTFTVTGSHTYATQGTFNALTVRISEGAATPTPVAVTGTATVADSDTLVATGSPVSATEATTFSGQVATFTDTYTVTPAASFAATIDWGDGTSSTGSEVTVTGASGAFTVSGSHVYAHQSSQTISVSISETGDGATASASATTTATVADGDAFTPTGVTIDTTAGVAFSGVVATFTDINATTLSNELSATIDWGDGSTVEAGTVSGSNGTFSVTGAHTYAAFGGPDSVTVVLQENSPGTASATAASTALIADPNLVGSPATLSATEGVAIPTTTTVATFTDSNNSATAADFTATIDWGDGTSSAAGSVSGGSGSFTITGGHTYAHSGHYAVSVAVFETATPSSPATVVDSTATAVGAAIQVTATPIGVTEGSTGAFTNKQVATFTDADASLLSTDFTATIDWGDGTSSTGSITGSNGTFTVTGGHEYAQEHPGTHALTMTVTIAESSTLGTTASATAAATVAEGDTLTSPNGAALTTTEGSTFSGAVAIFTDSNLDAIPAGFTAVINWGDGGTDAGSVTGGSGTFTVSGSHTYANDGFFTLTVNLVDVSPGTAEGVANGTATV